MSRIMVVDDDPISILYLQNILLELDHQVIAVAKSGPESVNLVSQVVPDLIFMDISMPGEYDGIKAAALIEKKYNIPIIFITSYGLDEFKSRVEKVVPFGYILKPFKEEQIKAAVYIAFLRKNMERNLTNALNKNRRSLYLQSLLSELLLELNKPYNIFDELYYLFNYILDMLDLESIALYQFSDDKKELKIIDGIFCCDIPIIFPEKLTISQMKIDDLSVFNKIILNKDFSIYPEEINRVCIANNVHSIICFPVLLNNELYGLLVIVNIDKNHQINSDYIRVLKIISTAFSLIIKRNMEFIRINEKERKEKLEEHINIRKDRLATIGQLSGAIIHEVNQPLQSIKILCDSILYLTKFSSIFS